VFQKFSLSLKNYENFDANELLEVPCTNSEIEIARIFALQRQKS